jgi:hypothetical protein
MPWNGFIGRAVKSFVFVDPTVIDIETGLDYWDPIVSRPQSRSKSVRKNEFYSIFDFADAHSFLFDLVPRVIIV